MPAPTRWPVVQWIAGTGRGDFADWRAGEQRTEGGRAPTQRGPPPKSPSAIGPITGACAVAVAGPVGREALWSVTCDCQGGPSALATEKRHRLSGRQRELECASSLGLRWDEKLCHLSRASRGHGIEGYHVQISCHDDTSTTCLPVSCVIGLPRASSTDGSWLHNSYPVHSPSNRAHRLARK